MKGVVLRLAAETGKSETGARGRKNHFSQDHLAANQIFDFEAAGFVGVAMFVEEDGFVASVLQNFIQAMVLDLRWRFCLLPLFRHVALRRWGSVLHNPFVIPLENKPLHGIYRGVPRPLHLRPQFLHFLLCDAAISRKNLRSRRRTVEMGAASVFFRGLLG